MKKIIIALCLIMLSSSVLAQTNKLPNAKLTDLENKEINILDAIDQLTIIDYWATWCKPCIAEIPFLAKIEKKYSGKLQVISISADMDINKWKKYLLDKGNTDHQYWVNQDNPLMALITTTVKLDDDSTSSTWSIPRFMLINKDGEILNKNCPEPSSRELQEIIETYLQT